MTREAKLLELAIKIRNGCRHRMRELARIPPGDRSAVRVTAEGVSGGLSWDEFYDMTRAQRVELNAAIREHRKYARGWPGPWSARAPTAG